MLQPSPSNAPPALGDETIRAQPRADERRVCVDPTLKAGAKLAQARAQLGISLEQAAERLRVQKVYIAALESMTLKVLPGKAYTLAYLKSYAELLGLDPAEITAQFQRESALVREEINPQIRNPESKPRKERPWLAAAAIGVVAVGFLALSAVGEFARDQQAAEVPAPAAAGRTPAAPAAVAARAQALVDIRPLAPAWLEVRGPDGTIFLSQTLEPGQSYRPDVGAGWTLHARDGGAFEVFVDGVLLGPLGETGAPVLGRRVDLLVEEAAARLSAPAPTPPQAPPAPPPPQG